jgi:hypothetical protein
VLTGAGGAITGTKNGCQNDRRHTCPALRGVAPGRRGAGHTLLTNRHTRRHSPGRADLQHILQLWLLFFLPSGTETVQGLGAYDAGSKSGLNGAAQVGLWVDNGDGGGIVIASTTIPAGSAGTQIGDFSYNGITPVTLQPMTLYYIASYQPSDPIATFQNADYSGPPIDPDLTVNADAYGVVSGAAMPDTSNLVFPSLSIGFVGADLGANFTDGAVPIYSGLPEPATLAILGTSIAGFAASRRRIARK